MIPRLICKLFGHKIWEDVYTGETAEITNRLTGNLMKVPIIRPERNDACPRCGKPLEEEK